MIAGLNSKSYARGEEIYGRVCANCHGTKDKPGSLPTSLRFAAGVFKNGSDPYSLYQTLTRGFGQMAPQTWMVPAQKYDVIQYIREAVSEGGQPDPVRPRRSRIPCRSSRRGRPAAPRRETSEPWVTMDYGPSLMATLEIGDDGANFAYKGIAVRLDAGQGGVSRGRAWTVYDHDTLRLAASWTGEGFIDWNGINFNGKHEVHPRVVGPRPGRQPGRPGLGEPRGRLLRRPPPARPRRPPLRPPAARLGALPGTLPSRRPRDRVVHGWRNPGPRNARHRASSGPLTDVHADIQPRPAREDLVLQVAHLPGANPTVRITLEAQRRRRRRDRRLRRAGWHRSAACRAGRWRSTAPRGSKSRSPRTSTWRGPTTRSPRGSRPRRGGRLFARAPATKKWARGGKALFVRRGKLVFDIGWVGAVTSRSRVDDDHWHDVALTYEHHDRPGTPLSSTAAPTARGDCCRARMLRGHVDPDRLHGARLPRAADVLRGSWPRSASTTGAQPPRRSPRPAGTAARTRITWWPAGGSTTAQEATSSRTRRATAMTAERSRARASRAPGRDRWPRFPAAGRRRVAWHRTTATCGSRSRRGTAADAFTLTGSRPVRIKTRPPWRLLGRDGAGGRPRVVDQGRRAAMAGRPRRRERGSARRTGHSRSMS